MKPSGALSGILHDFNNILNVAMGNAELLKIKNQDQDFARHIEAIISAGA
ncbi:MAG: hypothetical protein R3E95_09995 [Thiolinea sp.]